MDLTSAIFEQASKLHALPLLQAAIPQCTSVAGTNCLPVSPFSWLGFSLIAVFSVILIAAFIYMLSNIIKSNNAKAWARFQMYEAALTIVLIIAFAAFAYIFFINPQNVFGTGGLNIVPGGCTSATELFTLATCDVAQFNTATFAVGEYAFYATYLTALIPAPDLSINPIPVSTGISIEFTPPSLFPSSTDSSLTFLFGALVATLIANQIQLIVLSGSVLFLSLFLTIGLLARTLGFTRTFGGAMIAFGLGIGIIYPLLVTITYGYIDVNANVSCLQMVSCALPNIFFSFLTFVLNPQLVTSASVYIGSALGTLFLDLGYILSGLLIIPLINFAIVDAFIIDFSTAIGERMSFGELFSNFI